MTIHGQGPATWPVVEVSKQDASAAVTAAARTVSHRHCATCSCEVDPDRQVVHSYAGGFIGADCDLESALQRIQDADQVAWATHLLSHDLAVRVGASVHRYDVPRPERST